MATSSGTTLIKAFRAECAELGSVTLVTEADEAGADTIAQAVRDAILQQASESDEEQLTFTVEVCTYTPKEWAELPEQDFEGWDG